MRYLLHINIWGLWCTPKGLYATINPDINVVRNLREADIFQTAVLPTYCMILVISYHILYLLFTYTYTNTNTYTYTYTYIYIYIYIYTYIYVYMFGIYMFSMQNRLLLVEVKNAILRIVFDAKSTSTSRSEKCNVSNRFRCNIDFY